MNPSLLKCVFISNKCDEKKMIVTKNEVAILHSFIKDIISNEVVIINTDLGLDVYYYSQTDCKNIIENSFFLITTKNQNKGTNYRVMALNTISEISDRFLELSSMPMAFTCYTKNLLKQIKKDNSKNNLISNQLIHIWEHITNYNILKDTNLEKLHMVNNILVQSSLNPLRYN